MNSRIAADLATLAQEPFCYITTTGRVTGRPHTIEIWFALNQRTVYMLSGNGPHARADWVRNLAKAAAVTIRIRDRDFWTSTGPPTQGTSPIGAAQPCLSPLTSPAEVRALR